MAGAREHERRDFSEVADIDGGNSLVFHRQKQRTLGDDRRHLAKIGRHEFAGAQVREPHAGSLQPLFDLAMHARKAER